MYTTPYLMFKGECEEALNFYARVTGGTVLMMMKHRGSPAEAHTAPEWQDKIMHGRIKIGDAIIMASDAPPGRQYRERGGFCMSLQVENKSDAARMFAALSEGGNVTMPLDETFFADAFGMLTDRFGVPWMVACEKKM